MSLTLEQRSAIRLRRSERNRAATARPPRPARVVLEDVEPRLFVPGPLPDEYAWRPGPLPKAERTRRARGLRPHEVDYANGCAVVNDAWLAALALAT